MLPFQFYEIQVQFLRVNPYSLKDTVQECQSSCFLTFLKKLYGVAAAYKMLSCYIFEIIVQFKLLEGKKFSFALPAKQLYQNKLIPLQECSCLCQLYFFRRDAAATSLLLLLLLIGIWLWCMIVMELSIYTHGPCRLATF